MAGRRRTASKLAYSALFMVVALSCSIRFVAKDQARSGNGGRSAPLLDRLLTFRSPHELGRRRATINVGAFLQLERVGASLGQSLRAELHNLGKLQGLFQFLGLTSPTNANEANARRVVLELLGVRPFRLAGLGDHHDVAVATRDTPGH